MHIPPERLAEILDVAEDGIVTVNARHEMLLTAIVRDAADRKKYEDALVGVNQDLEERVKQRTAELRAATQQLWQAARLAGVGRNLVHVSKPVAVPVTAAVVGPDDLDGV